MKTKALGSENEVRKAVELSGASRMEFEGWLGERKIVRPFSEEDLRHELEWDWAQSGG